MIEILFYSFLALGHTAKVVMLDSGVSEDYY